MQFKFSALLVFVLAAVSVQAAPVSTAAVTITAPGAASVPAKPDGCAHITPAGQNAQNVCAKSVTASGFMLAVTDLTTGAKTNCKVAGTSGSCGTSGAGATIGAADATASGAPAAATDVAAAAATPAKAAKGAKAKKAKKAAKGGAAASAVTVTAPGATDVAAKPDGCAHITPAGANAQNVCAKSITATGFSLSVTDLTTGAKTNCKVTGTSGTCGTTGAGATIGAASATATDAASTDVASATETADVATATDASSTDVAAAADATSTDVAAAADATSTDVAAAADATSTDVAAATDAATATDAAAATDVASATDDSAAAAAATSAPAAASAKGKKGGKKAKAAQGSAAASSVSITAAGVADVPAKPDGCAHITPTGANAQNVCAKSITASGFKLTVTDLTTNAKSSCTIAGTSGTCGPTGAGATVSAAAKRELEEDLEERATSVPKGVAITITGTGATNVAANHFGCAHITPAGKTAQLVCTNDFSATGFTISVKDEKTAARTTCNIVGTTGTCGPSGAGATLSALPKREFEEDFEERDIDVEDDE